MSSIASLDKLPGFRRRFRITPEARSVRAEVEDDFHCMSVTIHHDGVVATQVEPAMTRGPWNTCPGAIAVLEATFTGVALRAFVKRGEKRSNCTHLHDLALLAAAHAFDTRRLIYDILVSDPVDGIRTAELRRNGTPVLGWTEAQGKLIEPAEVAGLSLDKLNPWIGSLGPQQQEAARLLRWGTMIAHGRSMMLGSQSDATHMPTGNCYTFKPERMAVAKHTGQIREFSRGSAQPLDNHQLADSVG